MSAEKPFDPCDLDQQLDSYAEDAAAQDTAHVDRVSTLGALTVLQDTVWAHYCSEQLPQRRALWDAVLDRLGDIEPEAANINYGGVKGPHGTWKAVCLRPQTDTVLELTTTVEVEASAKGLKDSGIPAAEAYIREPTVGKKCPEALLGVPASGGRFRKSIPLDTLRTAHDKASREFILANAWLFSAKTVVKSLGSAARTKRLYDIELHSGWVDENKRDFYLQHEYVRSIPKVLGAEADDATILEFLETRASGGQEIAQRFHDLHALSFILNESTRQ